MRAHLKRLVIAAALMAAAAICWSMAATARELAGRREELATFQRMGDFHALSPWRAMLARALDSDASDDWAAVLYWTRRYQALAGPALRRDAPTSLLMQANAAFRVAQREAAAGGVSAERLEEVVQAYAAVLKNDGFDADAAYNFEYVARLRDAIAAQRPGGRPATIPAVPPKDDDLPAGPTVHGRRGTHPPSTRGEEFEIIVPMDYGDREAQPEPTPGRPLRKKG